MKVEVVLIRKQKKIWKSYQSFLLVTFRIVSDVGVAPSNTKYDGFVVSADDTSDDESSIVIGSWDDPDTEGSVARQSESLLTSRLAVWCFIRIRWVAFNRVDGNASGAEA